MSSFRAALWAVVPAKEIWRSKQRLSEVLFPDERERLVRAMLQDVLRVLVGSPLADVIVVTRDGELGDFAREWGAEIVAEEDRGLNAALGTAAAHLTRVGAEGILVVPGDVPAVTEREIATLIETHAEGPSVTLVPDRRRVGTNALAVSPPDLMPFLFGEDSYSRHLAAAAELGVGPVELELPGLQLDVDVEEDLDALANAAPGSATADVLRSLGRFVAPAPELAASEDVGG